MKPSLAINNNMRYKRKREEGEEVRRVPDEKDDDETDDDETD